MRYINVVKILFFITIVQGFSAVAAPPAPAFAPSLAPFGISIDGRELPYNIAMVTLLPKADIVLRLSTPKNNTISLFSKGVALLPAAAELRWKAPASPGYYPIEILHNQLKTRIALQIFVMHPEKAVLNERLNQYRIGNYPPAYKNLNSYLPPKGFIEVTPDLMDIKVSPHFRLGQFLCKQESAFPKYLVLQPKLLEKLELLLGEVNKQGIRTDSFVVMSGYRTPFYNKVIGNVKNSRHLYGGAADIYIDVSPVDKVMDDLNRDGRIDINDSKYLYQIASELVEKTGKKNLIGGVGLYKSTASHGPFVHVDVRGFKARW